MVDLTPLDEGQAGKTAASTDKKAPVWKKPAEKSIAGAGAEDRTFRLIELNDLQSGPEITSPAPSTPPPADVDKRPEKRSSESPAGERSIDPTLLGVLGVALADQVASPKAPDDAVLESKAAVPIIFLMGLAGIVCGAAAGFHMYPRGPIEGAYLGGAIGWVAGFVIACLFVQAAERDDERAFCPTCGNYFPEGTEFCQWCGGVLVGKFDNPVARGGLHAGSYGLGNRRAAGIMAGMGLIGGAVAEAIHQAARAGACPDAWLWLPIGLVGLILAYLGGYLLEWLLSAIRQTARMENDWLQRRKQSVAGGGGLADMADASPPSLWPGRNLLSTAGALAIACVYVVPLVTLPLLPLALLHLATGGLGKALNVTLSLRRLATVRGLHPSVDGAVPVGGGPDTGAGAGGRGVRRHGPNPSAGGFRGRDVVDCRRRGVVDPADRLQVRDRCGSGLRLRTDYRCAASASSVGSLPVG